MSTVRKAVPLSPEEVAAVNRARMSGVLTELAGVDARSEASALHALVTLGLAQVREVQQASGYAQLAASMDDEDRAYHRALRGRRRGGADE